MNYTVNEFKHKVFEKVYEVYDIFKDFFGETHVDLQGIPSDREVIPADISLDNFPSTDISDGHVSAARHRYQEHKFQILVWWPLVTITNEHNKSTIVKDLYARVEITMEGRIPYETRGFKLNKSTYSAIQFRSHYVHSHVPPVSTSSLEQFQNPCLGRGPINNTIMDLKNGCEEALWMLFCQELSMYVTVESLTGGPYMRLEELGASTLLEEYKDYHTPSLSYRGYLQEFPMLKDFTKYYLENGHLALNYDNGSFTVGMSFFDYMIDISNAFIEWFNEHGTRYERGTLEGHRIIIQALAANQKFYRNTRATSIDRDSYEGRVLFKFKGHDVKLHIEGETDVDEMQTTTLLNVDIAMFILYNVLRTINYRYTNEHSKKRGSNTTSTTYQKVLYL